MFKAARLKLTAWYLLIIMLVTFAFSAVIFRAITSELNRYARLQRYRFEHPILIGPPDVSVILPPPIDPDLLSETQHRVLLILGLIDGAIFITAGALGYILAGKTLEPIQEMVEAQRRFISDASHELRTPITAFKTNLEVTLRDKAIDKAAKSVIKDCLTDANRLETLAEGLLSMAELSESGTPSFHQVSLKDEVERAARSIKSLAEKKEIKVLIQGVDLKVDALNGSLSELLTIFMENAVQYSPKQSSITVKFKSLNNEVRIAITDQGVGIAKADLPHIFDRFYRADASRSRSGHKGYGIGLSIADELVKRYGGHIEVKSKVGKGSTFTLVIPEKQG